VQGLRLATVIVVVASGFGLATAAGCEFHTTCYDVRTDRDHLTGELTIASPSGEPRSFPIDADENSSPNGATVGPYTLHFYAGASSPAGPTRAEGSCSLTIAGSGRDLSVNLFLPQGPGTFSLAAIGACVLESPVGGTDAGSTRCVPLAGQVVVHAITVTNCEPGWTAEGSFGTICAETLAFDLAIDDNSGPLVGHLSLDYATEIVGHDEQGWSCD
jgi:hypothetical protein